MTALGRIRQPDEMSDDDLVTSGTRASSGTEHDCHLKKNLCLLSAYVLLFFILSYLFAKEI